MGGYGFVVEGPGLGSEEVEVVPAAQLRGAVAALERVAKLLARVPAEDYGPSVSRAHRLAVEAVSHSRGVGTDAWFTRIKE